MRILDGWKWQLPLSEDGEVIPYSQRAERMETMDRIDISNIAVEGRLLDIRLYLDRKYGYDETAQDIAPLSWYIGTGRASLDFLRAFMVAKPFMVARKLHLGGSYEEVIRRIKEYIKYEEDE